MYKKCFDTLDRYPKIFLGFLLSAVFNFLLYYFSKIALIRALGKAPEILLHNQDTILALNTLLFAFIGSALLSVFLYPFLFNYIRNASLDIVSNDDNLFFTPDEFTELFEIRGRDYSYKTVLKYDWYKLILPYFLAAVSAILIVVLYFFLHFLGANIFPSFISFIGVVLIFIIAIIFIFAQIGGVCAILENNFKEGLRTLFRHGKKVIFSLIGTSILLKIPIVLLSLLLSKSYLYTISSYTFFSSDTSSLLNSGNPLHVALLIFNFLYGIYVDSFLYTYIFHKCIYEKCDNHRLEQYNIKFEGKKGTSDFTLNSFLCDNENDTEG
ncbi:MAG: hypothetical protein JXN65_11815 [Clostridia bacterium]|nr:hypothetical protein [Clostridia bacterium]